MTRETSPLRDRMIFLVGAQRSGTNWLQRIIAAHPTVFAVPSETNLFALGVQPLTERFHQGSIGSPQTGSVYMDRDAMLDSLRELCDTVFTRLRDALAPDAARILERTPDHVRVLDTIGAIYPDARFVHIIRDGRDVARSLLAQSWGPSTIADAAETWRSAVEAGLRASGSLRHYVEVRYEELLAHPREHIESLYGALDLEGSDDLIEAALLESRIPYNVDPSAPTVGTAKWRESFSAEDLATVERIEGETLRKLGYEAGEPAAPVARPEPRQVAPPRRSIRSLLRRPSRGPGNVEALAELQAGAVTAQEFIGAVHAADDAAIERMLSAEAFVQAVGVPRTIEGRDGDARDAFIRALVDDSAFRARQVQGDAHASRPVHTIVASYATENGIQSRVLVMWVRSGRIERIVYYRLPLTDRPASR